MKNKTLLLLLLNGISICAVAAFSLSDIPQKNLLITISAGLALVFFIFLTATWLIYISRMVSITSSSLDKQNKLKIFSLKNLDILAQHNQLINKKFKLSADFISRLNNTENDIAVDEFLRTDKMGQALLNIRADLAKWKEDESKRNWIAQGLARFSEILRNKSELAEYSQQIISNLIKYLDANRGILYIEEQDDEHNRYLRGVAGYAIEKADLNVKIYEGQGMLGQCMIEKKIILIKDVPKDYIRINSGLGQAAPKNIVIIPLVVNEKFYGAIEAAAFEAIEPYKIEFLKEIAESIASEIAAIKNHEQTQKLLKDSNTLTLELRQHESEMRNNMEELSRTQKEMMQKQQELAEIHKAIDGTLATAEFDLSGKLVNANEIFLKVLGFKRDELKGVECQHLMNDASTASLMWENISLGKSFSGEFKMKSKTGKELWLSGTFNPISISDKGPEKVMMFAQFTSQEKEKINDLSVVVNALKSTLPVVEFDAKFVCKSANEKFLKLFGVSRLDLRSKKMQDFIEPSYLKAFQNIQQEILSKDFIMLLLPLISHDRPISSEVTLTIARDQDGNIVRIILILVKEVKDKIPVLKVMD